MSANDLKVTISAVDKATEVVKRINRSFNKLTQPVSNLQKSVKAFTKEAGLDKIAKEFGNVGREARTMARSVGAAVAPMLAIGGAASVSGVIALSMAWGRLGEDLVHTADSIGISAQSLQRWQGVSRLAGLSAESMSSSLKSLGDTMEDALYGRNYEALALLNQLGVGIHKTASGAIDAERAFTDLADALAKYNDRPQVQTKIAQMFGLEESLPLLRQGSDGIEAYKKKVEALGGVMSQDQIERSNKFAKSLASLKEAGRGLSNAISDKLATVLGPLIDGLTKWITANREIIATKIGEFVEGMADALASIDWDGVMDGISLVLSGIQSFVDLIGGLKIAALAVVVMNRGLVLSFLRVGAAMMTTPIGLVVAGIAAITAAGYALYKYWDDIFDWFSKRWGGMGDDVSNGAKKINAAGAKISPPAPSGSASAAASSASMAAGTAPIPTPYTPSPSVGGASSSVSGSNGGVSAGGGAVSINVTFDNAPQGMKAKIQAFGRVEAAAPRINYTMPTAVTP